MSVKEAKNLAVLAHKGQFRRDGVTPFVKHPIAVADMMDTDEEKIVAYLHDVIEDTTVTCDEIKDRFGMTVAQAVLLLTKEHDDYYKYLGCISHSRLATKVKIADMFHNMSDNPSQKQKEKYLRALPILLKSI